MVVQSIHVLFCRLSVDEALLLSVCLLARRFCGLFVDKALRPPVLLRRGFFT